MAATTEQAPATLPPELDFEAILATALDDPEIIAGAHAAGVPPRALVDDVSQERAVEGSRSTLDELALIETRLRLERADAGATVLDAAHVGLVASAVAWLTGLARTLLPNVLVTFLFGDEGDVGEPLPDPSDLSALDAERATTIERARTALSEQVKRDLRAAVERRTADSYSTALRVSSAPGLAQLVDDDGVPTRATKELTGLLENMAGGSIGLAGRRGIGKSTLIRRFCPPLRPGQDPPLLATVVSAPTQYDGRDFILHLFARLCETAVGGPQARARWVRAGEPVVRSPALAGSPGALLVRARRPVLLAGAALILAASLDVQADALLIAGGLLVAVAAILPGPWVEGGHGLVFPRTPSLPLMLAGGALMAGSAIERSPDPLRDAGLVIVAAALALLLTPREAFVPARPGGDGPLDTPFGADLLVKAHDCLDDIQYQRTVAAGWTRGGGAKLAAGPAEVSGQFGASATRTLASVPQSFPEIVERLGAFLRLATTVAEVRIGIDELDKMESEETAHRFLNEIKGVFGISRCYFLVSVSEEAMSNFDRRGARLRDVFDSSFDEILHVPPLAFPESVALLRERVIGLPVPYLALCHVLSGGLPRDLIRVTRAVIAAKPDDRDGELAEITTALVALELEQRVRAVAVAAGRIRLEPQTSGFLRWARGLTVAIDADHLLLACSIDEPSLPAPPDDGAARVAHAELAELVLELRSFAYFGATVIEYFDRAGLAGARIDTQPDSAAARQLEALMAARAAAAGNPRVGWGLISGFRDAEQLVVYALPGSPPADSTG